jgi:flavodoxin
MKRTLNKLFVGTLFKIIFAVLLVVVILLAVGLSFTLFGKSALSATDTQSLAPTGYPVGSAPGSALVVYDPGSTGTSKSVSSQIASDLQAQGYFVFLAGIDSITAKDNASQYHVVIVGGPINNGEASSSVQSYLRNLDQGNGTRLGVFGVSTSNISNDQIAPLPSNSSLIIKEAHEINPNQNTISQSADFVNKLLS